LKPNPISSKTDDESIAEAKQNYWNSLRANLFSAQKLLVFLRDNGYLEQLYKYLQSDLYQSPNKDWAFLNFFLFLKNKENSNIARRFERNFEEITKNKSRKKLVSEVAFAVAIATTIEGGRESPIHINSFAEAAAEAFWDGLDISARDSPHEGDLRSYFFDNYVSFQDPFGGERMATPSLLETIDRKLYDKVNAFDFTKMRFDDAYYIFNDYIIKNKYFKNQEQILSLFKKVVSNAKGDSDKKTLSDIISYSLGDQIRERLTSPDSNKNFFEFIIDWYNGNYQNGFSTPGKSYFQKYPDLMEKINDKWKKAIQ
jgi:hypothetical protein